jgi:hypothetical protein
VSENSLLSIISEIKRKEVTTGLEKLRNNEVHNIHSSPNIFKIKAIKEDG